MNRLQNSVHIFKNVAKQIIENNSNVVGLVLPRRFYRFGRRVKYDGYYISPNWFDQQLLGPNKHKGVVGSEGLVSKTNKIFDNEKDRQKSLVSRIEKIEIQLEKTFPNGQDYVLMMNANLSTPYDCASHIHQIVRERSALAMVNGDQLWDMHRPLVDSCRLKLLHFKHEDTMPVNYAFWRSCSMLLASVIKKSFKDQFSVQIISQPMSDLNGGSFVCDVDISNLADWKPSSEELSAITSMLWNEIKQGFNFEPLNVNAEVARKLFADNTHRIAYIESKIANENKDSFTVYRLGNHVELSELPMISNLSQISSIFLSAVYPIHTSGGSQFYRFQGIALPKQLHLNPYTFTLLKERAKKLNPVGLN